MISYSSSTTGGSGQRHRSRRNRYHKLALKNKLRPITEEYDGDEQPAESSNGSFQSDSHRLKITRREQAKTQIVRGLASSGGDSSTQEVQQGIDKLVANYDPTHFDPRRLVARPGSFQGRGIGIAKASSRLEDIWTSLSRPQFKNCCGVNDKNECMYTLGQMAFGMFRPTNLVCSIQGTFNEIDVVDGTDEQAVQRVPSSLEADVRDGNNPVRTYNIVTAFTIEPHSPKLGECAPNKDVDQPIKGVMTTYGYALPYPKQNRFSVWFTGGSIEPDGDSEGWNRVFNKENLPGPSLGETGKLLVAKLLFGVSTSADMDENGKISYQLNRPVASYIDLLYMDEKLRIMRGSSGHMYIFARHLSHYFPRLPDHESIDISHLRGGISSLPHSSIPRSPARRCSPRLRSAPPRQPKRSVEVSPAPPLQDSPPRRPMRRSNSNNGEAPQ